MIFGAAVSPYVEGFFYSVTTYKIQGVNALYKVSCFYIEFKV